MTPSQVDRRGLLRAAGAAALVTAATPAVASPMPAQAVSPGLTGLLARWRGLIDAGNYPGITDDEARAIGVHLFDAERAIRAYPAETFADMLAKLTIVEEHEGRPSGTGSHVEMMLAALWSDLERTTGKSVNAPAPSAPPRSINPAAAFTATAWVRAAHQLGYSLYVTRNLRTSECGWWVKPPDRAPAPESVLALWCWLGCEDKGERDYREEMVIRHLERTLAVLAIRDGVVWAGPDPKLLARAS
ncbi:MAG: hypothetical protein WDO24_05745 [Pseudomonadota bacterium]